MQTREIGRRSRLVRSAMYWLVIGGILVIADPGRVRSQQSEPGCNLTPITTATLNALPATGSLRQDEHMADWPPPTGEPIDYFMAADIQEWLDAYTACLNDGDVAARFSVYTPDLLARIMATNPDELAHVRSGAEPVSLESPVTCTLIRAWRIESGHVVALIQVTPDLFYNTLLLTQVDGEWLVDDRWNGQGEELLGEAGTGPLFSPPVGADDLSGTPEPIPTRALW